MDIFKIRTFIRAVELGNLSKAASELLYAPSALSHMVKTIEKELAVKLLDRSPGGIKLTKNGQQFYPIFKSIVEKEDEIYRLAKNINEMQDSIKIGTYASISKNILPRLMKEFNEIYPNANISIVISDRFSNSFKDFDIIFSDKLYNSIGTWVPLFEDEYFVITKSDLFPDKEVLKIEDLTKYPFIVSNHGNVNALCCNMLKNITYVSSNDDTSIISMVSEGLGNAILPKLSIEKNQKCIKVLKLEPSIKRTIGISFYEDKLNFIGKQFIKFVKNKTKSITEDINK